jgi:hypothetical protein
MNNSSQYNGKTVDISGSVQNTLWKANAAFSAYQIFDGSGDIWVVTSADPPAKGTKVNVKGAVTPAFTLDDETLGTVVNETQRN